MSTPVTDSDSSQPSTTGAQSIIPPSVREIHKNGWLKKLPQTERRVTPFGKVQKPEKMWIVFCIHDDVEAFLEYYENRRSAFSHQPTEKVALANCLHISPSIVIQENQFVFSITMENHSLKLAASTREQMTEWIDTLRGKLTELGVLSPPNNLYSRGPEVKPILAPSRDPTSPLPLPPTQVPAFPLGVEPTGTTSRMQTTPRVQESSIVHVSHQDMSPSLDVRIPSNISSSSHPPSRTNQSSSLPHHPSPTPPLLVVRGESENRAMMGPTTPSQNMPYDAAVSPTTSVTAQNAYTNVSFNVRNDSSEAVTSQHNSQPDSNGNQSISNLIYEPLCLASTATPSYVNTVPNPNYNVNRNALIRTAELPGRMFAVANDILRDPLRPRARSGDRNSELNTSNNNNNNINGTQTPMNNNVLVLNPSTDAENSRPMTLKEKQVSQLCREMKHKSGVRLTLGKKDCINSIAFAEHLGCLWICGWKQKDHPLLYHNFHIGDRVISVAGQSINTLHDFNRVIKAENATKIEFVIGRLPYGLALAIKRDREGQDLGIIREGNTAEIIGVTENSIAAKHGLPLKALSTDCYTQCNWMLTEINGRSLNLFFKDTEIQDRLNAVGKDISILVQPSDFVKALKKQLRALWNYKEYIVQ